MIIEITCSRFDDCVYERENSSSIQTDQVSHTMAGNRNNPTVLTVHEVAKILRIGRISAYQAIERGDVPSIRIGRRILVPRLALEQLLGRAPDRKTQA
jgi:excisionase family DNA binding protein